MDDQEPRALRPQPLRYPSDGAAGLSPCDVAEDLFYGYLNHPVEPTAGAGDATQHRTDVAHRPVDADLKTIADFRRAIGPAVRAACAQFIVLCRHFSLFTWAEPRGMSSTKRGIEKLLDPGCSITPGREHPDCGSRHHSRS